MKHLNIITTMLLDIDGTLLDSNDAHAQSWLDVFRRHGHHVTFDQVRPFIGKGTDKLLPELLHIDPDSAEAEAMAKERSKLFAQDLLPHLRPTKGARALLARLRGDGVTLVVATSAGAEEVDALLEQAGVRDLIDRRTTADDAKASKPDPDIVHAALSAAGSRRSQTLMLGDTPYDIAAAKAAGIATIALRCGGWWDDAALGGAAAIHDHPQALLAAWPPTWPAR